MTPPLRGYLSCAVLVLLAFSGAAAELHLHVASKSFIVSVAPVDEVSRDADNSILYQRDAKDEAWRTLGPCDKAVLPGGDVRFTREVTVPRDGVYQFTSRPVVGGDVASPPEADSLAQAVVVVDTLAPVVSIHSPEDGVVVRPGAGVTVVWEARDENLADRPSVLFFTTDGGQSWNPIARDLPASGNFSWNAPGDLAGPALLRLIALDRAGNAGRDVRRLDAFIPPVPGETGSLSPLPSAETAVVVGEGEDSPGDVHGEKVRDPNRSWLYYLMAVNLMRQEKPADALQYYWLSVKEDPDFIDAWADIGLAYIDLGAYKTAREVVVGAREKAPERIDLLHLLGETYHAEGMRQLERAASAEDRVRAKGLIDQAVEWYGRALAKASEEWRLAEQAPSFYRLGEICYYVNLDRDGARAYWEKILELHTPSPNRDLVLWTPHAERNQARRRHQKYTYMRVSLDAWQNWARGYIRQLDERERAGILDLMPAQRIVALPCEPALPYGGNVLNPGRDDGRSLFSLPTELGSPSEVEACSAVAGGVSQMVAPVPYTNPLAGYSFYAKEDRSAKPESYSLGGKTRGGRSAFTGGPDAPPPPNPDPYAFPGRRGPLPGWHGLGPYGDRPE